jgi:hypothetical protein
MAQFAAGVIDRSSAQASTNFPTMLLSAAPWLPAI